VQFYVHYLNKLGTINIFVLSKYINAHFHHCTNHSFDLPRQEMQHRG